MVGASEHGWVQSCPPCTQTPYQSWGLLLGKVLELQD